MTQPHPLEPLTADEISAATKLLRDAGHVTETCRFAYVTLHEPAKGEAAPADRRAEALVVDRSTGHSYEAVVSLGGNGGGKVRQWRPLADAHGVYLFEELSDAIELAKADPRYQEALAQRGITDLSLVQCDPWPAGNWAGAFEPGRRILRVVSYSRRHEADNGYARPIEGVIAVVDVVRREVVEVQDHGVVPLPDEDGNYDAESVGGLRTDLRPVEITQPDGPSFEVRGNEISWQRWRLRVSMHPLDGLVLHDVRYEDGGRERPVLHRAALAEMVVPYGSTAPGHWWKNAFDSGELGLGRWPLLNSLELGCDCLGVIHYLDVVAANEQGEPAPVPNAICIHEEDFGILWKHVDLNTFTTEVRRQRRLVVSSIHTVGNYEYGFYWYLYLDGTIEMEVKLTGILQTMAVAPGEVGSQAEIVGDGVAAPHHQHLFCFRLDLDVDGATNSVYEVDVEPVETPRANAFAPSVTLLRRESEAQRPTDSAKSRHWRVVNAAQRNRLGQPVAYRLVPASTPRLLAGADSVIRGRAGFAAANLWVTAYDPDERRAAGHPNLHPGGAGLAAYVADDAELTDTDVVLWYTFGVTHVARPEDWPVMPVERCGFLLQPWGFFDRNPALDVPPPQAHCSHSQ